MPLGVMLLATCGLALVAGRRREALAVDRHAPWTNAFPSGHATAAASIAISLALVAPPRLRPLAIAIGTGLTAVVSVAVIALQWHYPSDVLGGILIASGWGFAALAALRFSRRRDRAPEVQTSSRFAISLK